MKTKKLSGTRMMVVMLMNLSDFGPLTAQGVASRSSGVNFVYDSLVLPFPAYMPYARIRRQALLLSYVLLSIS